MMIPPGDDDGGAKHCIYQPFATRDDDATVYDERPQLNMSGGVDQNESIHNKLAGIKIIN